jgi:hypothetical protein
MEDPETVTGDITLMPRLVELLPLTEPFGCLRWKSIVIELK